MAPAQATPSASGHSSWSAAENALPGTAHWQVHPHKGREHHTVGYADVASALPGQRVRLFVSSPVAYRVVLLRIGWYGGDLARRVWSSAPLPAVRQPAAVMSRATSTVRAPWHPTLTLPTERLLPGDYLARLDGDDGDSSYVPLTIRFASAAGKVVLINADTTWQAYNLWGCCDLYAGADGSFARRARVVSFDRPYENQDGAGQFISRELPVVVEAERLGLDLGYVTDTDLETDPHVLDGARAVISLGHDEYWSVRMRQVLTAARDGGANLAFLGANAVFRRIRLSASPLGPARTETNYKVAAEDPLSRSQPSLTTANWNASPDPQPESSLVGPGYQCVVPLPRAAGVVVDPTAWLFAGTGVSQGTRLPGLIGPETDGIAAAGPTPRPMQVLLHSPHPCAGGAPQYADTTYYTLPGGAGVFAAGTIDWACALGGGCFATALTHRVVRGVTDNLLRAFAAGPAGRAHPAKDNVLAVVGR